VPPAEWTPETEDDREAVRRQMERVLATSLFKNSKRYPSFLRYVVGEALSGRADQIKERALGVEVFGRTPDYNTSEDHVVRTAAGEVRRRIIQYYAHSGATDEIRIDLPSGSYAPRFYRPEAAVPIETEVSVSQTQRRTGDHTWLNIAAAVLATAAITFTATRITWSPSSPLDRFWQPVLESPAQIVVSIGQGGDFPGVMPPGVPERLKTTEIRGLSQDGIDPPISASGLAWLRTERVNLSDSITGWRIASYLQSKGKQPRTQGEYGTDFSGLRSGSAVLIGAFNNAWTQRLTGQLRFTFAIDRTTFVMRIRDNKNASREWVVDGKTPNLKLTEDYAIVSRVYDSTTERVVVVVGGLTKFGTTAAGEFLTDSTHMAAFARQSPDRWENCKHLQVVIATNVINGRH
jgi:hypothetical protein